MMASVSRAGMSSRRADAAPDQSSDSVRFARTRRTKLITTRATAAQCFREKILKNFGVADDSILRPSEVISRTVFQLCLLDPVDAVV
jgi:hypothetical protein